MALSDFLGSGNALRIKSFIEAEFPALTWNFVSMKCMKMMIRKGIVPTKLGPADEFDREIIDAIHQALVEREGQGLPNYSPVNQVS